MEEEVKRDERSVGLASGASSPPALWLLNLFLSSSSTMTSTPTTLSSRCLTNGAATFSSLTPCGSIAPSATLPANA